MLNVDGVISFDAYPTTNCKEGALGKIEAEYYRQLNPIEEGFGIDIVIYPVLMLAISQIARGQSNYDAAEKTVEKLTGWVEDRLELGRQWYRLLLEVKTRLISVYVGHGRYADVEKLAKETIQEIEELLGDDHPDALVLTLQIALSLMVRRKLDEA